MLRSYDATTLSPPGLGVTLKPRPHQVAAVARMIHEPTVGLYHEVGAGKTAEMVMGCMELRRLGLVQKPVVVVPTNLLEQFAREWQQLYPQARLLIATVRTSAPARAGTSWRAAPRATGTRTGLSGTRTVLARARPQPQPVSTPRIPDTSTRPKAAVPRPRRPRSLP